MTKKLCKLCRLRPAAVPDRNIMGRPIKKICRECHAARICGDLARVLEFERMRRQEQREEGADLQAARCDDCPRLVAQGIEGVRK